MGRATKGYKMGRLINICHPDNPSIIIAVFHVDDPNLEHALDAWMKIFQIAVTNASELLKEESDSSGKCLKPKHQRRNE